MGVWDYIKYVIVSGDDKVVWYWQDYSFNFHCLPKIVMYIFPGRQIIQAIT